MTSLDGEKKEETFKYFDVSLNAKSVGQRKKRNKKKLQNYVEKMPAFITSASFFCFTKKHFSFTSSAKQHFFFSICNVFYHNKKRTKKKKWTWNLSTWHCILSFPGLFFSLGFLFFSSLLVLYAALECKR